MYGPFGKVFLDREPDERGWICAKGAVPLRKSPGVDEGCHLLHGRYQNKGAESRDGSKGLRNLVARTMETR